MVHTSLKEYNLSYWERKTFFDHIDVCIIGSGIVGLNAALYLVENYPGIQVVIVERGALPIGASTRNAGFACFGSPTELADDLSQHTPTQVWDLVAQRWAGLQRLRARVGDKALGYKQWGGYELFRTQDQGRYEYCLDELQYFNQELERITGIKENFMLKDQAIRDFGFKETQHLIWSKAEGQIDTGKMMATLLQSAFEKGIKILNGVEVLNWDVHANGITLRTKQNWTFLAQKLIIATNAFAKNLIPALKLQPARNQVLITKVIPNLKIRGCFHYDQGYYYFRNIDNRILLGGGRNLAKEVEQTAEFGTTDLIKNALQNLLTNVILPEQKVEVDYWWSGIIGVGGVKEPIIQKLDERMVVAVRLGGMGVAIGSLVGEKAAIRLMES